MVHSTSRNNEPRTKPVDKSFKIIMRRLRSYGCPHDSSHPPNRDCLQRGDYHQQNIAADRAEQKPWYVPVKSADKQAESRRDDENDLFLPPHLGGLGL